MEDLEREAGGNFGARGTYRDFDVFGFGLLSGWALGYMERLKA
jgi:hypothetical protein